jgi:enoyl-[acyl-carrier protein] reductase I
MLLQGRNGIVFGVANKRSIAYACARTASQAGARLIITYQNERLEKGAQDLAASLPGEAVAVMCDVGSEEALDAAFATIGEHMSTVHFAVHSIAFANREELSGEFVDTSRQGFATAAEISAYSLTAITHRLVPLMTEGGGIVTMSYMGAEKVVPRYNVMGPAKAALEASVRYLAYDLGPKAIRVNALSPGPIRTLAAAGIGDFSRMLEIVETRSPLRRNVEAAEVADACLFLCSDMSRGITGTTLHVDAGFNITTL